jgi:pantoate--beta-alanine ligase
LEPAAPRELGIRVVHSEAEITRLVQDLRQFGRRVGLVPTMGALHAGHISLVETARRHSDTVVTTIFVNPTQFAPHEDLGKYPRTLDADLDALSAAGCDLCFAPAADAIYPPGFSTFIEPPTVAQPLEGACRPGHFRGVATIVLKLFHLVPAHIACFGEKDYQQLQVIRRMVHDLSVPIEIIACPTLREPDGLALSSRNRYLSPAERQQALALSRALSRAAALAAAGERNTSVIESAMHHVLRHAGLTRIDYAVIADPQTLAPIDQLDQPARALIAAHVGATRLIDNRQLDPA